MIPSPLPLTVDQRLDNISDQIGTLSKAQLQADAGGHLARRLLHLYGTAHERRDLELMRKAAGSRPAFLKPPCPMCRAPGFATVGKLPARPVEAPAPTKG